MRRSIATAAVAVSAALLLASCGAAEDIAAAVSGGTTSGGATGEPAQNQPSPEQQLLSSPCDLLPLAEVEQVVGGPVERVSDANRVCEYLARDSGVTVTLTIDETALSPEQFEALIASHAEGSTVRTGIRFDGYREIAVALDSGPHQDDPKLFVLTAHGTLDLRVGNVPAASALDAEAALARIALDHLLPAPNGATQQPAEAAQPPAAQGAPDPQALNGPCALLTAADVEQVVGTPMAAEEDPGLGLCAIDAVDVDAGAYVSYSLDDSRDFERAVELRTGGPNVGWTTQPVGGLGDTAVIATDGSWVELFVKIGDGVLSLTVRNPDESIDWSHETATTLARIALGRLS